MTAEEIRASKNESDNGAWEGARWLQEIAAQMAESNAANQGHRSLVDEVRTNLVPKLQELFESLFHPPAYDAPALAHSAFSAVGVVDATGAAVAVPAAAAAVPAAAAEVPAKTFDPQLIDHLTSQGHSVEKAQQILSNHEDAVRAEFEAKGVPDGEKEKEAPTS